MQHTAGNYEAFARPRPAQHAQETKAYIVGSGLAGAISFGLESIQTWLPARVPSNLDLACNSLGGFIGSLLGYALRSVLSRATSLSRSIFSLIRGFPAQSALTSA